MPTKCNSCTLRDVCKNSSYIPPDKKTRDEILNEYRVFLVCSLELDY